MAVMHKPCPSISVGCRHDNASAIMEPQSLSKTLGKYLYCVQWLCTLGSRGHCLGSKEFVGGFLLTYGGSPCCRREVRPKTSNT